LFWSCAGSPWTCGNTIKLKRGLTMEQLKLTLEPRMLTLKPFRLTLKPWRLTIEL
jgi:hypothetical protein